ncbi:MAG TPA: hypothetical protein PLD47_04260 [Aggregatilineales bacterium]|nr:hypothetical protein [Anaerolineales bacterium]HRE46915.1 hypothetical protein [Aggregatilineales bacterium]
MVIIAILIAAARGRRYSEASPYAQIATFANGMPCPRLCLFGIFPGATPFEAVEEALAAHPLTADLQRGEEGNETTSIYTGATLQVFILRDPKGDVVRGIVAMPIYGQQSSSGILTRLTLGDTMRWLGTPAYVRVLLDIGGVEWMYPRSHLIVATIYNAEPNARLTMFDGIGSLQLYTDDFFTDAINVPTMPGLIKRWQGFSRVLRYRDLPTFVLFPE